MICDRKEGSRMMVGTGLPLLVVIMVALAWGVWRLWRGR